MDERDGNPPGHTVPGEVVLHRRSDEPVHDWDLLSPRFQLEATAYLQILGVAVALFVVTRRSRQLLTLAPWRREKRAEGNEAQPGTSDVGEA